MLTKTPPATITPVAANDQPPIATRVPAYDTPEKPLLISFVGISRAEQRAALAGFPGGRRFILDEEAA